MNMEIHKSEKVKISLVSISTCRIKFLLTLNEVYPESCIISEQSYSHTVFGSILGSGTSNQ